MTKLITTWNGGKNGMGKVENDIASIPIAIPKDLQGSGQGFNPKELLCAATGSCFFLSLVHLIEIRKITIKTIVMASEVLKENDNFKIKHEVTLVLPSESTQDDIALASRTIDSAEASCNIGNLAKEGGAKISVEKSIELTK